MSNQSIMVYVDRVMSNVEAPNELKIQMENELLRYIMENTENTSINEVKNSLCSPEKFAEELTKKLVANYSETPKPVSTESNHVKRHRRGHYHRYAGEFMQEHSNVNLRLLYIPLLQISSGTQRLVMPLTDDEDEDD